VRIIPFTNLLISHSKVQELQAFTAADASVDSLKTEFSKRLGDLERKLAAMKKVHNNIYYFRNLLPFSGT
jgi:hypothetical protein